MRDVVDQRLPVSLELMVYAQLLSLLIAIPLGVYTAYKQGSRFDGISNTLMFALLALPTFVLALLLQIYVGAKWDLLPTQSTVTGTFPLNPIDNWQLMLMPTIALAAGQIAVYMRLLRSDMIATLQEDFITTAKAKGIKPNRVLFYHALRPSSLTLLTVAGLNVGALIGGAIVIEAIFGLAGHGRRALPRDPGPAVPRRALVRGDHRDHLRAVQLLRRHPVLRPRPPDPACPSTSPKPFAEELVSDEQRSGVPLAPQQVGFSAIEAGDEGHGSKKGTKLGFGAWAAILFLVLVVGSAILAPILPIPDPNNDVFPGLNRAGPSLDHLFGVDANGRDVLARVIWGGRNSLGDRRVRDRHRLHHRRDPRPDRRLLPGQDRHRPRVRHGRPARVSRRWSSPSRSPRTWSARSST